MSIELLSLRLKRMPTSMPDFIQGLFSGTPDLILVPWNTFQLTKYIGMFQLSGFDYVMSRSLGLLEFATIVSRVKPGSQPLFLYFTCIKIEIWMAIFISILLISVVLVINRRCPFMTLEYYWCLYIILFTKSLQKFVIDSNSMIKCLIGMWLMSALIISTQFTGFLLDYMSQTNPVLKIDSLEDLVNREDMRIYVPNDSTLYTYIEKETNDSLAIGVRHKMIDYNAESWLDPDFRFRLLQELKSGSISFTFYKMTSIFQIIFLNKGNSVKFSCKAANLDIIFIP